MSSFIKRREEFTKIRTALKKISLKNRKKHLIKKIINLLRDKSFDEIDAFEALFFFQRVNVLLSTLIMKKQIFLTLKKINIRLKNLEKNTTKIISTLSIYANVTKTKSTRSVDFAFVTIASYNNINQQRQLKKTKREKRIIFKIKEKKKREKLKMLSIKKLMKHLQRIKKTKKNVLTTRRLLSENVKIMTKTKKIKNHVMINETFAKSIASSTYIVRRMFEMLTHDVRVIEINTINQKKQFVELKSKTRFYIRD
jgi:Mg2+ and Co2+ transporter CorA